MLLQGEAITDLVRFQYHENSNYWDRWACANSADPDQTAPEQSDLGLHCLPFHISLSDTLLHEKKINCLISMSSYGNYFRCPNF